MQLKLSLNVACTIAKERNGFCLSDKYINSKPPLKQCCSKGHERDATIVSIKNRNSWCPTCADHHSFHLEIAKRIAKERDGLCLSNQCKATKEILQWKCSNGHEWSTTYNNVIHGIMTF